jgi:GNAT superfamily N-acetyltransferase
MQEETRNRISFDGWVLEPFHPRVLEHDFDCGKEDLNDFFCNEVADYEKTLMAKTYTLSPEEASVTEGFTPVAFISFCNDAIVRERVEGLGSKSQWHKIVKDLPHQKRFGSLPAVKIARLGVQKNRQGKGVGTALLNMTKRLCS